jgi:hypothetical protein
MSSTSRRLVRAWLSLGVIDLLWAVALSLCYGRAALSAFTGVAAVALAPEWTPTLAPSAALGVALHFGVAFTWATIYLLLQHRSSWLTRVTSTRRGQTAIGIVYGPFIWLVMSALVIPLMTGDPLVVTGRWAIQLAGHVVFVGLPVVLGAGRAPAPTAWGPKISSPSGSTDD